MGGVSAPAARPVLDAALRKAAAVWLRTPGHPARLVWALWPSRPVGTAPPGSLLVASGGTDQAVPGLVDGAEVVVTVAGPGGRTRLAEVTTTAVLLAADEAVTAALVADRRNAGAGWAQVHALALLGPADPSAATAVGAGPPRR